MDNGYLLLDVKNRDVVRNCDFSATQSPQKRTFSYTVLTNKTVAMTISQNKGSIGQDTMTTNSGIDTIDPDILALGLRVGTQLERVNSHVELLVRHGFLWLVEKPRRLILDRLHLLLLLLGGDLALSLLELLPVHSGLDLSGIGGFQVDVSASQTQCGRHVALRPHVNRLVELLRGERHLASLGVNAIGRAQSGNELRNEVPDSFHILLSEVA